jgi:hypothetical protein
VWKGKDEACADDFAIKDWQGTDDMATNARIARALLLTIIGLLATLGLLDIVGRLAVYFTPDFPSADETREAMAKSAALTFGEAPARSGDIFVSFDGRDPDERSMNALQRALPTLHFVAMSLRPEKPRECARTPSEPGLIAGLGPCDVDNYIEIRYVTTIYWRTVEMHSSTAACFGQYTMFRGGANWHVLSETQLCV